MSVEFVVTDVTLVKTIKVKLEDCGLFVKPIYSDKDGMVIKSSIASLKHPLAIEIGNVAGIKARVHEGDKYEHNNGRLEHQSNSIMEFTKGYLRDHVSGNDEISVLCLLDHLP
ncbi:TRM12-like protein [Saccharomyces kudriavzevii IFO 1802]|nr:TRM12-like protein [Saccharomyces kudriavzevii IFO 1802]